MLAVARGGLRLLCILVLVGVLRVAANAGPNEDILAAATAGDRAGVEAALAKGASVNAVDPLGLPVQTTPLGIAAANGHKNIAEFLLDHGANVNGVDGLEQAPLHMAAEHGSADVAKLLLDRGADVDARDVAGATPLGWAALWGQKVVASLLIARGALVNARALSGKTPLHLAAAAGKKELVALLLTHGADPTIKNSDGQTPLQETQASSLDPAAKSSVAALLRAPARKSAPPATVPAVAQAPSSVPAQPSVPACSDVGGIARLVMQTNPGTDWTNIRNARVLAVAVEKMQVAMGCRQAPQKTECSWVVSTWTCTTQ
jgi:ankyrin repeat protein